MCFDGHFIRNKYTGNSFFVKCGHCEACQQEKANRRTNRLRNELRTGHIALFVTLTYDRDSCPYIKFSDIEAKPMELPVYRDVVVRRSSVDGSLKRFYQSTILDKVSDVDYFNNCRPNQTNLKPLAHRKHNVGVIYYPDAQNFVKRLRINLKRKYFLDVPFKVFICGEYGESTCRPHFHLLVFIPSSHERSFRTAIPEAWPYANQHLTQRNIEVARNAASYVSSYVNCGSDFPAFLRNNFSPKHSFSKGLGMGLPEFQLDKVLQKIHTGNLSITRFVHKQDGLVLANIPIPKYVINRYFPIFKGYSRITGASVCDVLRFPLSLYRYKEIEYTSDDIHKIKVRIRNAYDRYFREIMDFDTYLWYYERAWCAYRSTVYRLFLEDDIPDLEKYDNLYQVELGLVKPSFHVPDHPITNPNFFNSNIQHTHTMSNLYRSKLKTKRVNNIVMFNLNDCF